MKLSIIIPVYDVEKYISKCLDSILKQLTDEVEIIVINDGSTDSSMSICQKMLDDRYSNVKLLSQENRGLAATRNRGIEEAKSDYIMFLDSDDELAPDAISKLLVYFSKYDGTDIFYFDAKIVEDEITITKKNPYNRKNTVPGFQKMKGMDYFKEYYVDRMIVSVCLCVFKTKLIKENYLFFDNNRLYEDNVFSFRSLLACKTVCYLPNDLYVRRYRKNSITIKKPEEKNIEDICFIIRRYVEYKKIILEYDDLEVANAYLLLIYKTFIWGKTEYIKSELQLQCMDDLAREIYNIFVLWPKKFQGVSYWLFQYFFIRKNSQADIVSIDKIYANLKEKYRNIFDKLDSFSEGRIAIYGRGKHTDILKTEYKKLKGKELAVHIYLDSFENDSITENGTRIINITNASMYVDFIILSSNYYRLEMINQYNNHALQIPIFDFYEVEKMNMFDELLF